MSDPSAGHDKGVQWPWCCGWDQGLTKGTPRAWRTEIECRPLTHLTQPQPSLLWTNTQRLSGSLHKITTEILQLASSVTSDKPSALHLHFPKCKMMEWNLLTTWTSSGITSEDRLIAIRSSQGRANSAMAIVKHLSTYQFHFIQLFNYHHKYTQ